MQNKHYIWAILNVVRFRFNKLLCFKPSLKSRLSLSLPFCTISVIFFSDTHFLTESILESVILSPNTAFQLNEYLDKQATSEIHCRTHCACCAPQRHWAGYEFLLGQLPTLVKQDVVALGRAVLPNRSSLREREATSRTLDNTTHRGKQKIHGQFAVWLPHSQKLHLWKHKQSLSRHYLYVFPKLMSFPGKWIFLFTI